METPAKFYVQGKRRESDKLEECHAGSPLQVPLSVVNPRFYIGNHPVFVSWFIDCVQSKAVLISVKQLNSLAANRTKQSQQSVSD